MGLDLNHNLTFSNMSYEMLEAHLRGLDVAKDSQHRDFTYVQDGVC